MAERFIRSALGFVAKVFEPPAPLSEEELLLEFEHRFGIDPNDPLAKDVMQRQIGVLKSVAQGEIFQGMGFGALVPTSLRESTRALALASHFGFTEDPTHQS